MRTLNPNHLEVPRTCPFGERIQQRDGVVRQIEFIKREEREDRCGESTGGLWWRGAEREPEPEQESKRAAYALEVV